jgi:hypothetical protein
MTVERRILLEKLIVIQRENPAVFFIPSDSQPYSKDSATEPYNERAESIQHSHTNLSTIHSNGSHSFTRRFSEENSPRKLYSRQLIILDVIILMQFDGK